MTKFPYVSVYLDHFLQYIFYDFISTSRLHFTDLLVGIIISFSETRVC